MGGRGLFMPGFIKRALVSGRRSGRYSRARPPRSGAFDEERWSWKDYLEWKKQPTPSELHSALTNANYDLLVNRIADWLFGMKIDRVSSGAFKKLVISVKEGKPYAEGLYVKDGHLYDVEGGFGNFWHVRPSP